MRKARLAMVFASLAAASFATIDVCPAQTISLGTRITVEGRYTAPASDKDDRPRGISGMACLGGANDSMRECLVVNDEETFAEIAILKDRSLRPTGRRLSIVEPGESGKGIVGTQRIADCGDQGKFGDADGEGIAVSQGYVYIASSHSCSGAGKYKPSNYLLSRSRLAGPAAFPFGASAVVERSWRGADMLIALDAAKAFGKPKKSGTNIEGIAVVGEHLYAGLRTPLGDGSAFLIRAPIDALFAPGTAPLRKDLVETRSLSLGEKTGVRDLAALADGSLLILSDPSKDQPKVDYKIWHLPEPVWSADPIELVVVRTKAKPKDADEKAKAESLTVLEQNGSNVVVMVNYDNIDEGAPAKHELDVAR